MRTAMTAITFTTAGLFLFSLSRGATWWGPTLLGIFLTINIFALIASWQRHD